MNGLDESLMPSSERFAFLKAFTEELASANLEVLSTEERKSLMKSLVMYISLEVDYRRRHGAEEYFVPMHVIQLYYRMLNGEEIIALVWLISGLQVEGVLVKSVCASPATLADHIFKGLMDALLYCVQHPEKLA